MTVTEVSTNGDRKAAAAEILAAEPGISMGDLGYRIGVGERQARNIRNAVRVADGRSVASGAVPVVVTDRTREGPPPARTKPTITTPTKKGKPRWPMWLLLGIGIIAGLVVASVTAVSSYSHLRHLAEIAGQSNLAAWYPLGVDGLVAFCSVILLWDRQHKNTVSRVAQLGAGFGLAATFIGNGMAFDPDLASVYVAGLILAVYPPVALAVVWHLLNRMLVER